MIQDFLDSIYSGIDVERVWRRTEAIWQSDRWMSASAWRRTAHYVARELEADGAAGVEIVECSADGESEFFGQKVWPVWEVTEATLEIVGSEPELLGRYSDEPRALMTYSAPTPKEGIEAELVRVNDGRKPEHYRGIDVKGKIVFTRAHGGEVASVAADKGAVGVLSDFVVSRESVFHLPALKVPELVPEPPRWDEQMQWMHVSGDRHGLFGFAITPAVGARLREQMGRGPVRVRAKVDSEFSKGTYPAVTGLVRGSSRRGEQVLVLGHLYEQGAGDNASGCAVILEVASCLNALIRKGALPKPKRDIRLLLMLEMQGSAYYLHSHREQIPKTLAALCLDCVGDAPHITQVPLSVNLNPESRPSFTDAALDWLMHQWLDARDEAFQWITVPFIGGTDNIIAKEQIGIPCPWIGEGNRLWHTTADTMETLDRRTLAHVSTVSAAYSHFIAAAGPREARVTLSLCEGYAERRLARCADGYVDQLAGRRRAKAHTEAVEAIRKERDQGLARLRSVLPMVSGTQQKALEPEIAASQRRLRRFARMQEERLGAVTTGAG